MKRRRTMLLCVTATSMAAVVGCRDVHAVGTVAAPIIPMPPGEVAAPASNAEAVVDGEADTPIAQRADASTTPGLATSDSGVIRHAVGRAPFHPPDMSRVGTTADAPDTVAAPMVGTTAHVPDRPKK
jgi:hypothetical protein